MIFVYEADEHLSFWMKNTTLPLTLAFLSRDGEILQIEELKPLSLKPVTSDEGGALCPGAAGRQPPAPGGGPRGPGAAAARLSLTPLEAPLPEAPLPERLLLLGFGKQAQVRLHHGVGLAPRLVEQDLDLALHLAQLLGEVPGQA